MPEAQVLPSEFSTERQEQSFRLVAALVLAVVEVSCVYLMVASVWRLPAVSSCLGQVPDVGLPWPVAVLVSRGILQPMNLLVFAFALNTLVMRLWNLRAEFRAFLNPFFQGVPSGPDGLVLDDAHRAVPLQNATSVARGYAAQIPLLVRRVTLASQRLATGADAGEIHDALRGLSSIDRDNLESRLTLVRYAVWLVPTIGFLGTVVGMGLAITGFSNVIVQMGAGSGDFQTQLQEMMGDVSVNLGTAFDTTVLALLLSALLVAVTSVVQTREEALLSSIDEFCLEHFIGRLRVSDMAERVAQAVVMTLGPLLQSLAESRQPGAASGGVSLSDLAGQITRLTALTERVARHQSATGGGEHDEP